MWTTIVLAVCLLCVCAPSHAYGSGVDFKAIDQQALAALQSWYSTDSGAWTNINWWQSANALNALIDYSIYTQSNSYATQIQISYNKNQIFFLEGIDDEGWWGLAWTRAYTLTKNDNYLNLAVAIWKDMAKYWDNTCGGGVWWDRKKTYKNAVTNELFFQLSSALYLATNDTNYLSWSERSWNWIASSTLINSQNLINDGINTQGCKNNGQTTWTYNQGVVLGGLVNLWKATKNNTLLTVGLNIAQATFKHLVYSDGILQEPCEPSKNCDGDQTQFKGIFMRNLGYLYGATKDAGVGQFITNNVNSFWNRARTQSNNTIGVYWEGPFDAADAARQSSAVEAINAAILVSP